MHVLVTGGCGYVGSVLVPKLLAAGHSVEVWDLQWFGNFLEPHINLVVKAIDIRKPEMCVHPDAIIHLASVANDPSAELDPSLTWETIVLGTMRLCEWARRSGVDQFLYASSASVYGIKTEEKVTEDLSLEPVSLYNKAKMCAERIVLSYADGMTVQIVRPATVCGMSPRMRLDLTVNLLTMQALTRGRMSVYGGAQTRPNIHIQDMARVYLHLLESPHFDGIYNAGFDNISILGIAKMVHLSTGVDWDVSPSNDPRSYRVDSSRLLATGFAPRYGVIDAIWEMKEAYNNHVLKEDDRWHNLKWMRDSVLSTTKSGFTTRLPA